MAEDDPIQVIEEQDLDEEMISRLYEETLKSVQEGKIIEGSIVKLGKREVIVDVGLKSEGVIPLSEFKDPGQLKEGDKIEVYLESTEDEEGLAVLSKQKADFLKVWEDIQGIYDQGSSIQGKIIRRVKGGMIVDILGVDAFLPGSQIDLHPIRDLDAIVGENFDFSILKLNWKRRNVVVSRRKILEAKRDKMRQEILEELEEGQIREGVVKNITDYGAFIDLGGVDGLLHITDISWGRVIHPSEHLSMGQKISVKVIGIDEERKRVSLGMKQLTSPPWERVPEKYVVGKTIKGKVVSITDYGVFVELEKGVEGLIHISELSWTQRIRHPSDLLSVGDEISCVVIDVNPEKEQISLSFRKTTPDPWEGIEERHPVGSTATGRVKTLTNFGAFVEIENGIDGLIHVSDMSWTERVSHPSEEVKEADQVEVVILQIDKEQRRISLGMKQTKPDPVLSFSETHPLHSEITAKISHLLDSGALVDLGSGLTGFVPFSHMMRKGKSPAEKYVVEEEISCLLHEVNPETRRIILSETSYYDVLKEGKVPDIPEDDAQASAQRPEGESPEEKKPRRGRKKKS
ncbi:30S ribosomal protein S1 [candidate division TA06 bacterium]|nr:30S ribosomal protein S1 [candidate division TA06 bacterium]